MWTELLAKIEKHPKQGTLTLFGGVAAEQSRAAYPVFCDFLASQKFALIVELGTRHGGFALFLHAVQQQLGCGSVYTYELADVSPDLATARLGIQRVGDVLQHETIREIELLVRDVAQDRRALILCDGGCKIAELAVYSRVLRIGDYIGVHDYGSELFDTGWQSIEINKAEARRIALYWQLQEVGHTRFNPAMWGMFHVGKQPGEQVYPFGQVGLSSEEGIGNPDHIGGSS